MTAVSMSKPPSGSPAAVAPTDTRNIHQRLHAVMQEVDYVQKDKKIDVGGGYKVVTHDAVTAKVRPVLVRHGVMYYPQNLRHEQNGNRTEVSLDVVFVNVNDPQDKVAVPTFGYGIDPGDKGPGKAVSYAIKYALLKALGLETGEDADTEGDTKHTPAPKNAPGISQARREVNAHCTQFGRCADRDEFMDTIAAERALWVKVRSTYPALWQGPDGAGLRGEGLRVATAFECREEFSKFLEGVIAEASEVKQPMAAE